MREEADAFADEGPARQEARAGAENDPAPAAAAPRAGVSAAAQIAAEQLPKREPPAAKQTRRDTFQVKLQGPDFRGTVNAQRQRLRFGPRAEAGTEADPVGHGRLNSPQRIKSASSMATARELELACPA